MSESLKILLIIGKVWPESRSSAAGSRMLQLIQVFVKHGFDIHFASAATKSDYSDDISSLGVTTHAIKLNDASFDHFVKRLNPAIVMFDRFMTEEQYGWRVAEHSPDTIRILDTEDLHSLRYTRQKRHKEGIPFHPESMVHEEITKRELASIYRSDLSIMISTYEMDLLQEHFKISTDQLCYLPFLIDPISNIDENHWPSFDERRGFMMIGNFLHAPNRDAVKWLKNEVWPRIRFKLPDAELNIYGSYMSQNEMLMDNRREGFLMHGRVENLHQVIAYSKVMLVPLRFGAGLKGKLFDAMLSGTPSVTTSIGSEGISDFKNWCGAVYDDPNSIADAAVNLYLNQTVWQTAQKRGISIINEGFTMKDHVPTFIVKLTDLMQNTITHRKKQFIGSMLMHHTMAGSRYMSKWIEEKEKQN